MLLKVLLIYVFYFVHSNALDVVRLQPNEPVIIDTQDVDRSIEQFEIVQLNSNDKYKPGNNHHHDNSNEDDSDEEENQDDSIEDTFDSWSIIWYIASFGGLIAFFLVVSCSEWCCRKHVREQQARRTVTAPRVPSPVSETPPPAYDLFAPPSYDSLSYPNTLEKSEFDIFVVPVHAIGSLVDNNQQGEEEPPSYNLVSQNDEINQNGNSQGSQNTQSGVQVNQSFQNVLLSQA